MRFLKQCFMCKRVFGRSLRNFYPCKTTKDRLRPECRQCAREKANEWNRNNKARQLATYKAWRVKNPDKPRRYSREARMRMRAEFLAQYGHVCACCGESGEAFLTLEHKRGGGRSHRASVGGTTLQALRDLKRRGWPKDDYELLCMNCNWAKRHSGPCPHQQGGDNTRAV